MATWCRSIRFCHCLTNRRFRGKTWENTKMKLWSINLMIVCVVGCVRPGPVDVDLTEYDQSCEFDDDCVIVAETKCQTCSCSSGAIAASEEDRYSSDYEEINCVDENQNAICGACQQFLPACVEGTCESRAALYPANLEASCSSDDDCTVVPRSEACDCSCEFTAVNQTARQEYDDARAQVECTPRPACRCEEPETTCNEGSCELAG